MLTIIALILAFIFLPSPWNVIVVLVTAVVDTVETGAFVWWSRRRRRTTPAAVGVDSIVGRPGVAIARLDSDWTTKGQVRVDGEIWAARSTEPVDPGAEVRVVGIDGLTLDVEPIGAAAAHSTATPSKEGSNP
jgi:membrane-bound serine protease (ClpP class)